MAGRQWAAFTPSVGVPPPPPVQVPKMVNPPPMLSRAGLRRLVGVEARKGEQQVKSEMRQVGAEGSGGWQRAAAGGQAQRRAGSAARASAVLRLEAGVHGWHSMAD